MPPPFWMAMVTPWSLTRSSIASAIRLPIWHSTARQLSRLPSMAAPISATLPVLQLLAGEASFDPGEGFGSGTTLESRKFLVSPTASVTTPASSKVTAIWPRYLE